MPGQEALKAYVGGALAALAAGLAAATTALEDGAVSAQEWTIIAGAVVVALGGVFGGVYAVANKPKQ
jgi:hypothetical protein